MFFNRSKVKQPLAIKFKHKKKLTSEALGVNDLEAAKLIQEVKMCLFTAKNGTSLTQTIEYAMQHVDFEMEPKHLAFLVAIIKDISNPVHKIHKLAQKELATLIKEFKKERNN